MTNVLLFTAMALMITCCIKWFQSNKTMVNRDCFHTIKPIMATYQQDREKRRQLDNRILIIMHCIWKLLHNNLLGKQPMFEMKVTDLNGIYILCYAPCFSSKASSVAPHCQILLKTTE